MTEKAHNPSTPPALKITLGPERDAMADAQQPFLFRHSTGRLLLVGQFEAPLGTPFPGVWASATSDDDGQTWAPFGTAANPTGIPGAPAVPFYEGCAAELPDGAVLWLEWSARGPEPGGYWIARLWESRDALRTLAGPVQARIHLPLAKGGADDDGHPVPEVFLHRSLLVLPGGDLLMSAYGWFLGDDTPSTYRASMNKFRTLLLRSSDRGRNWSLVSTVAVDPAIGEEGFNEPAMARLTHPRHGPRIGRLIALLRTGSNKTYPHNPIYQAESGDLGRSSTKPLALPFENVDPDILEMDDGLLVATFGHRSAASPVHLTSEPKHIGPDHGNYISFSHDGGQTWTQTTRVTSEPSSCYTAVRQIGPGRLLYCYDVGDYFQHVWVGYERIRRAIACRTIDVAIRGVADAG